MHTTHHDDTPVPWRNSLSISSISSGCQSMDGQSSSAFRPIGPDNDSRRFRLRAYAKQHAKRGSSVPPETTIPFPVMEEDIKRDQRSNKLEYKSETLPRMDSKRMRERRRSSTTYSNVDEKPMNRKSIYANVGDSTDSLYSNNMDDSVFSEDSMYDPSLNTSLSSVTLPTHLDDQSSFTTCSSLGPSKPYTIQYPVQNPPVPPEMLTSFTLQRPSPIEPNVDKDGDRDYRYRAPRCLKQISQSPSSDSFYYRRNLSCPSGLDSRNYVFIMQYKYNYKGK